MAEACSEVERYEKVYQEYKKLNQSIPMRRPAPTSSQKGEGLI
jgi:hypothetical protein